MTEKELEKILLNKIPTLFDNNDFFIGKYVRKPNVEGVLKINKKWFVYDINEKAVEHISGPFSDDDIVCTVALRLRKSDSFKEYHLSRTGMKTFFHNHFRSFSEAKAYAKLSLHSSVGSDIFPKFFHD